MSKRNDLLCAQRAHEERLSAYLTEEIARAANKGTPSIDALIAAAEALGIAATVPTGWLTPEELEVKEAERVLYDATRRLAALRGRR